MVGSPGPKVKRTLPLTLSDSGARQAHGSRPTASLQWVHGAPEPGTPIGSLKQMRTKPHGRSTATRPICTTGVPSRRASRGKPRPRPYPYHAQVGIIAVSVLPASRRRTLSKQWHSGGRERIELAGNRSRSSTRGREAAVCRECVVSRRALAGKLLALPCPPSTQPREIPSAGCSAFPPVDASIPIALWRP